MREHAVEDIAETPAEKPDANTAYRVLYDGQCEICQACVSWLKVLDHDNKTVCLPISAEVLSAVDPRLRLDECLRQLHVLTPEGGIYVGWDAVACLARLARRFRFGPRFCLPAPLPNALFGPPRSLPVLPLRAFL